MKEKQVLHCENKVEFLNQISVSVEVLFIATY